MKSILFLFIFLSGIEAAISQEVHSILLEDSVRVTIDRGGNFSPGKRTTIIFYALPNGNTTEQTMGKVMTAGDDWHYDIQHIAAQARFIRSKIPNRNIVVVYLENSLLSWPAWKKKYPGFRQKIPAIVDTVVGMIGGKKKEVYLNGHSGGGSFIFGFLAGVERIPQRVKRISFLDSNYGYDSTYYPKLAQWLREVKGAALNVFAYNDSVVIYNGKPLVSPTGGTWYRSRLILDHFAREFQMRRVREDSLIIHQSSDGRIRIFLRKNPEGDIFHTQQVEFNGFIHSILCGTAFEYKGYEYFGKRAYTEYIE